MRVWDDVYEKWVKTLDRFVPGFTRVLHFAHVEPAASVEATFSGEAKQ
jgi:hypothetical protein